MRILALNLRAGGGRRIAPLLAYLDAQASHTVVLSEWYGGGTGMRIAAWAEACGMLWASAGEAGRNGVFVASRAPFVPHYVAPLDAPHGALLLCQFAALTVLACYFPQRGHKA